MSNELVNDQLTKLCSKCKIEKSKDNFYLDRSHSDGLQSRCKDCVKIIDKNRYNSARVKEQYDADPRRYLISSKKWKTSNPDRAKVYHTIYCRERRHSDLNFRLADNLRSRLNVAIKNDQKKGSAVSDLGCTIEELKFHLERQFQPGMSWGNWSINGWHIDHIKPLSNFDLSNKKQLLEAIHYTNLQPLWAKNNIRKGSRY